MKLFKLSSDNAGEFYTLKVTTDSSGDGHLSTEGSDEIDEIMQKVPRDYAFAMSRAELESLAREILSPKGLGGAVSRQRPV